MDQRACHHSRTDKPKKETEKLVYRTATLVCFVHEVAVVLVVVGTPASFARTVATGPRPNVATFRATADPS